jgi:hypothetical protein
MDFLPGIHAVNGLAPIIALDIVIKVDVRVPFDDGVWKDSYKIPSDY